MVNELRHDSYVIRFRHGDYSFPYFTTAKSSKKIKFLSCSISDFFQQLPCKPLLYFNFPHV